MKRTVLLLVGVVVIGIVGAAIGIRLLDHDIDRWHVDPVTAAKPSTPNSHRAGNGPAALFDQGVPVYPVDAATLSTAWDRMIEDQPRVSVVADDRQVSGETVEGIVTYVQRSALFGFPDYISVRFVSVDQQGDGGSASTLVVFSRSRLGQSDLGVNERRVTAWLAGLETALG